nr:MupG family TIM beta-alpha barrel fold protein [Clostridium sp. Marseille-P2415]
MGRMGISIYPEHSEKEKDLAYIRLAGKYGFQRIFTCLLSVEGKTREQLIGEFKELNDEAHRQGMEVIMDANPEVFRRFNVTCGDLSFFSDMHADGIRLDEAFEAGETARMTFNPHGLKIELNSSMADGLAAHVMSYHPRMANLITCHNFYPQRYTGLSLSHFERCNEEMKQFGLRTAAFVSSNREGTFGPWPVNEGLCTLEMHRDRKLNLQVRHLLAAGMIDDVIIANAYASEEELAGCAALDPGILTFRLELEKELAGTEKAIVDFETGHVVRGDMGEYMIRSSLPRVAYKDCHLAPDGIRDLKKGDVVILNEGYGRYKGELHIILKDIPNDGRKNVIGHIPEEEWILFDYVKPWTIFGFIY